MPYGLYLSAEGAEVQSLRMDVIANNLANVETTGFKRQLAVSQARYAEAIELGLTAADTGSLEDLGGGVMTDQTATDFSPGPLVPTGNKTDVAIKGEGFFLVQKGEEAHLTRAGNFSITPAGNLVTQQGYSVLSQDGNPITVDPSDPTWEIAPEGTVVSVAGSQNLALVQPASLGDLVRVGENLFRSLSEPQPLPANQRGVIPRHIEGSGVKPTTEMVEMIHISRAFEANVNMMKTQDEMLSGLVNRVLRV